MTKPRLDTSRDYNEILPAGEWKQAHYSQDGHYFNQHGEYLFSDEGVTVGAAKAAPVAPSKPARGDADEPVSLRGWALGHQKVPFFTIRKEMKLAGYSGDDVANPEKMREALIREGVITAAELGE